MNQVSRWIQDRWYRGSLLLLPLRPLSSLVAFEATRRLKKFRKDAKVPPVPVIVVGNITVGGTGKTPLVIALVEAAQRQGLRVVVISRGYGSRAKTFPLHVTAESDAREYGDEPVLIAQRTGAPVVLNPDRKSALNEAIARYQPDVVISDDGLQHYRLPRSVDVVLVDGQRGLGNGRCLPEGPLREPAQRLHQADFLISTTGGWPGAQSMYLEPAAVENMADGRKIDVAQFCQQYPELHAVAGIGNPARFFNLLQKLGLVCHRHPFSDHHTFRASDFAFAKDEDVVLMTEKDAVKCRAFAKPNWWFLPVEARLPPGLTERILAQALATPKQQSQQT